MISMKGNRWIFMRKTYFQQHQHSVRQLLYDLHSLHHCLENIHTFIRVMSCKNSGIVFPSLLTYFVQLPQHFEVELLICLQMSTVVHQRHQLFGLEKNYLKKNQSIIDICINAQKKTAIKFISLSLTRSLSVCVCLSLSFDDILQIEKHL